MWRRFDCAISPARRFRDLRHLTQAVGGSVFSYNRAMTTLHVVARAIARAGNEVRVREQFEALVEPTRAEPGCLYYELLLREDNPAEFVFVQEYRDDAAFETHLASAHVSAMLEVVLPLLAEPPDIRRYQRLS